MNILHAMDIINMAKQWIVDIIMDCMNKYFTLFSFGNIQGTIKYISSINPS